MDELIGAGSAISTAAFLTVANSEIVDYIFRPIRRRWSDTDFWWILYVGLVTGLIIGWVAQVNLFGAYVEDETLGRVLSAITIGGGSSLVHEIFGQSGQ